MNNRVTMHLSEGPRRRTTAVSDQASPGSRKIDLPVEDLAEYLLAKQIVDKWQKKFGQHRRNGWSW